MADFSLSSFLAGVAATATGGLIMNAANDWRKNWQTERKANRAFDLIAAQSPVFIAKLQHDLDRVNCENVRHIVLHFTPEPSQAMFGYKLDDYPNLGLFIEVLSGQGYLVEKDDGFGGRYCMTEEFVRRVLAWKPTKRD